MSQHINLLQHRRRPIGSALAALALLSALLLGLLAYETMLRSQAAALRQELANGTNALQQSKAALLALGAQDAGTVDNIGASKEIEVLKSRLVMAKKWSDLLDNESLGTPAGYLQQFNTLSRLSEDGLWLTSILISDGGKRVNLDGRALRSESVLRYAEKLNRAFSTQGVQFNSVEMTPEDVVRSNEAGTQTLSSVSFRLF